MQSGFFISSSNCSNSINGRQAGSHVISLFSSIQLSSVQFNSARQQQHHKLLATCRFSSAAASIAGVHQQEFQQSSQQQQFSSVQSAAS